MAFPTTGILDDFNRPNESPLSDGGNWLSRNTTANELQLVSHFARGVDATTLSSRYWSPQTYGPNCEAYVSAVRAVNYTTDDYVRLWLRITNPGAAGETGYVMQWSNDVNGLRIFNETARETFSTIAQDAAARWGVAGATDQLGIEAVGTNVTVYQNGTSVLTVSDSTYTAAGYLALGVKDNDTDMTNFGGGTISQAKAPWLTTL